MFNYSRHIETTTRKSSVIYVYNFRGYQKNIYWIISVDSYFLLLAFLFLQDSKFESIWYSHFLTSIWRTRGRFTNLATFKEFFITKTASLFFVGTKTSILEVIGFLDLVSRTSSNGRRCYVLPLVLFLKSSKIKLKFIWKTTHGV